MPDPAASTSLLRIAALSLAAILVSGPLLAIGVGDTTVGRDWRTASRAPMGYAPAAVDHHEAVVQVYAAHTVGWRGAFAVHTWVAAKPAGADAYTRYEVIGWRSMRGGEAIAVSTVDAPDARWFGAAPALLRDLRGAEAEAVIAKLPGAVKSYPWADRYTAWPGPNSNTFVAWIGREIPELRLAMPANAIGKDYLPLDRAIGASPSHTGLQLSLWGLVGAIVGLDEGIELNVLGLVAGIDLRHPALKLPGVGRIGVPL